MKTALILALAAVCLVLFLRRERASSKEGKTPVEAMAAVAAAFPRHTTYGLKGNDFVDVSYDIQTTDSLVNPLLGYLNFSEANSDLHLRYVFHWLHGQWVFSQMINRENGKDFTDLPGGIAMMRGGEMKRFLERYGWRAPEIQSPTRGAPTPAPEPGSWMWNRYRNPLDKAGK